VQVALTCRHGEINGQVREYITTKSEKLLNYFERVAAIAVTVDFENSEKDRIKVEILVDAEHKNNFVARDVGGDVPSTFDRALHKMEQQIRRYKEKLQDHRRDRPLGEVVQSEATEAGDEPE
jgi:putative sigma-54 modulation protein